MSALVIFDMDGVLVDSEPAHLQVDRELMSMFGITISEPELCGFVGMSPRGMWSTIKEKYGLAEDLESLLELESSTKVREFDRLTLAHKLLLMGGGRATLVCSRHWGVPCGRRLACFSVFVLLLDPGISLGHTFAQRSAGLPVQNLLDERVVAVAARNTRRRVE